MFSFHASFRPHAPHLEHARILTMAPHSGGDGFHGRAALLRRELLAVAQPATQPQATLGLSNSAFPKALCLFCTQEDNIVVKTM